MPLWLLTLALSGAVAAVDGPVYAPRIAVQAAPSADGLSGFDRDLLEKARYSPADDGGYDGPDGHTSKAELPALLERLRAERRRKALASLEQIQDPMTRGLVSPAELAVIRGVLARDWEVLPPEVRDRYNDILASRAEERVKPPDLSSARRAASGWARPDAGSLEPLEGAAGAPVRPVGPDDALIRSVAPPPAPLGDDDHYRPAQPGLPSVLEPGRLAALAPPAPEEVARRVALIDKATYKDPKTGKLVPYSADVQKTLEEIMRFASKQDSEAVLRVLAKRHPVILRSNAEMLEQAGGVASHPEAGNPEDDGYKLVIPDSYSARWISPALPPGANYGVAKQREALPLVEGKFYQELGLPTPDLEVFDPKAKPRQIRKEEGGTRMFYSDGSERFIPDPRSQAVVTLHEILHLDTYSEGFGAHALTNEMRSFYAMERLRYNRDAATGRAFEPGYKNEWLTAPAAYRANILEAYMSPAVGEVKPDEVTVQAQLSKVEAQLKAPASDVERFKSQEVEQWLSGLRDKRNDLIDRLVQKSLITDEQAAAAKAQLEAMIVKKRADAQKWDYRAYLEDEHRRLLEDQSLALSTFADDYLYHREIAPDPVMTKEKPLPRSTAGGLP